MKKKKTKIFGLGVGKFFVILFVVLASAFFLYQYMFVINTKGSKAADGGGVQCCGNDWDCASDEKCKRMTSGAASWAACGTHKSCEKKDPFNGSPRQVNLKCNCTDAFGSCGDRWGMINIKTRECSFALHGSEICNYNDKGKLYQWVSCN